MERNSDQRDNSDSAKTKESWRLGSGIVENSTQLDLSLPRFFIPPLLSRRVQSYFVFTDSTPGIGQYKLCLKKIIFLAGYANPLAFKVFKLRNYREIYEGKLSLLPTLASAQLQMPRVVSQRTKKRLMIHVCVWSFRNR